MRKHFACVARDACVAFCWKWKPRRRQIIAHHSAVLRLRRERIIDRQHPAARARNRLCVIVTWSARQVDSWLHVACTCFAAAIPWQSFQQQPAAVFSTAYWINEKRPHIAAVQSSRVCQLSAGKECLSRRISTTPHHRGAQVWRVCYDQLWRKILHVKISDNAPFSL